MQSSISSTTEVICVWGYVSALKSSSLKLSLVMKTEYWQPYTGKKFKMYFHMLVFYKACEFDYHLQYWLSKQLKAA